MILQQMIIGVLDIYHERVRAFHVKDAEYTERAVRGYGGYQAWIDSRDVPLLGDGR